MASYKCVLLPSESQIDRNCIILCISKASSKGDTSCLYAANMDNYDSITRGNPFRLTNKEGLYLWNNHEISMARLRVGVIAKYRIVGNQCVYVEKTKKLWNTDQIQMDLSYGFNAYEGLFEACPRAIIQETKGCYLPYKPEEPQIFLISIVAGIIQDERITFLTKRGECLNLKLNCRDNLTLSAEPSLLQIKPSTGDEVEDVAVVKFGTSPIGRLQMYAAVCEGLILRYKPNVISIDDEPLEIKNNDGFFVQCPGLVTFDTGNTCATGISSKLVKTLNLEKKIDHTKKIRFTTAGSDVMGNPNSSECATVEITLRIRRSKFKVMALVGAPVKNIDLLIGMDIIEKLTNKNFTLGK